MKAKSMHHSMFGRTLALLLTAAMLFGLLSGVGVSAYADEEDVLNITSQDEFDAFVSDVNTNKNLYTGITVNLLCDVNTKTPIGTASIKFAGTFDGNGHTVTAAISGTTYQGLFAYNNGTIKNLILEGTVSGSMYCGGIAGNNSGTIDSCINNAKCDFTGSYVGGIVGFNGKTGSVTNCINNGAVTTTTAAGFCGGIAGGNSGTVENCYNTGKIGNSTKSFAIMGSGVGTVTNCFYLEGSANDDKAAVKTDAEMKSAEFATAMGDGFAKDPNGGYPVLKWQIDESGEPHEHTWNDGEVTKEATVDEEGVMTYTCTVCGETKTEAIPVVFPFEYTIENNAVTITKYIGTAAIVEVPAEIEGCPVTSIAKGAFGTNTVITEVKLPESVKSIGQAAFTGCSKLEKINLEAVTEFAPYTFLGCSSLDNVVLNDEITTLPVYMFSECSSLSNIKLPAKLTALSNHLFDACESLKTLDIPNSVTLIDRCAFEEAGIATLIIPASVTEIGDYAFEKCENLTSVTLGENVEKMGSLVFWDCKGLKAVVFNDKLTSIPVGTFFGCSALESVTLGKGITAIESNAFKNCTALKDIEIGREVSSIGENAFAGCTVTIHGYTDSTAFTYAKANEINFTCIEHSFGDWEVTQEASCNEKGIETRTCPCGEAEKREIATLEHTWNDGEVTKEAAVAVEGEKTYTCTVCGEKRTEAIEALHFDDVKVDAWYHDAVHYCAQEGLFNGVSATTFAPNAKMTRAMFVTVLYRMAGSPDVSGMEMPFTDVKAGWAYDAIVWAYNNGITKGMTATTFAPNAEISRAQLVTMLYRAEGSPAVSGAADFADAGSFAAWSADAIAWASANGIVNGYKDNTFKPNNTATRAEMATIMYNMIKA